MDILNVGNLFNSKWGVYKTNSISNNGRILNYKGIVNGEPTFDFVKSNGEYLAKSYDYYVNNTQCWGIQFGLRYLFN